MNYNVFGSHHSFSVTQFADLEGFASWSSTQEPPKVFDLLDIVYGQFESMVKRRRIFKVDTVGDCFVGKSTSTSDIIFFKVANDFCFSSLLLFILDYTSGRRSPKSSKRPLRTNGAAGIGLSS